MTLEGTHSSPWRQEDSQRPSVRLCGGWEWVGQTGTDDKNHHVDCRRLNPQGSKEEAWRGRQELIMSGV